MNTHWSADLGFRYEHVKSEATGGFIGVDTNGFVPRLAVAFDPGGNGRNVFHATYGHYSGRYNEAQIGANNNVGNPDLIDRHLHWSRRTGPQLRSRIRPGELRDRPRDSSRPPTSSSRTA